MYAGFNVFICYGSSVVCCTDLNAGKLMVELQFASVIALRPAADPVMVSHRARAAAQAASIAASLVESEKVCKEYAMAFFPAEARVEGILFWDMILELVSR